MNWKRNKRNFFGFLIWQNQKKRSLLIFHCCWRQQWWWSWLSMVNYWIDLFFFSTGNSNTHKVFHNSILLVIIKCSTLRRLLLLFWFLILDIFSFFFCTKVKWGKVCNRIRYIFGHRQQQQWNAVANFHFFKFWKKQPVKINHHNLDIQNNNRHHHHYQFIWELKF